jgi:hypothetical protein
MKNIHALPTDKPSLYRFVNGTLKKYNNVSVVSLNSVHIYITDDSKIKEEDWCIDVIHNTICKRNSDNYRKQYKKIILTTDQDLIKDGVQAIDDDFLEWFVKNPSCEYIKTEKWLDDEGGVIYSRIIPKEEPKQSVEEYTQQGLEKYAYELEPKQETLEEFRSYYIEIITVDGFKFNLHEIINYAYSIGVKFKQEQDKNKYSEEEVKNIVEQTIEKFYKHRYVETKSEMKELWFEQFKKKLNTKKNG